MNNLNVAKIQLNGDPYEINYGTNLNELLNKLKIQKNKVAIEVNGEIVEKNKYLNFKFLIIFWPTGGVTAKKTQLQELTISWLFFAIETFLNCLLSFLATFLFLGDKSIFLKDIFDLHIPVTTENVILPVPTKPNFITVY